MNIVQTVKGVSRHDVAADSDNAEKCECVQISFLGLRFILELSPNWESVEYVYLITGVSFIKMHYNLLWASLATEARTHSVIIRTLG